MKEQYYKSIEFLKTQKEIILNSLKNIKEDINACRLATDQILNIDNKLKLYYEYLENDKNTNLNHKFKDIENSNIKQEKDHTTKEIKQHKIDDKATDEADINKKFIIKLENDIIESIIKNNGKATINILHPNNKFEITYTYKHFGKNVYYYHCNKRPKCKGAGKFKIDERLFYITKICSGAIFHNNITYTSISNLLNTKQFEKINFKDKKTQSKVIKYIYNHIENYDNINIKQEFMKFTKEPLLLSNKAISRIKSNVTGKLKNLTLLEIIEKINSFNLEIESYTNDIKYTIKLKNNELIERKERIVIFGNKERIKLLNNKNCIEFFIDITFDVVPKKFKPLKLMSIATIDSITNKTYLVCFIFIRYQDAISYERIFDYLKENFLFNPQIIHTDFEASLAHAIKNAKFFSNKVIHVKCLFHFVKSLMDKLKKYGLVKKNNIKEIYTIVKNIELICFIDIDRINDYKKFLLNYLSKYNKYNKFINYLKNYWFKKSDEEYNYSVFIKKYINNENKLDKLYLTNNIIEQIHSRINSYMPKHSINNFDFINIMKNIFINDSINNKDIIRYDYKTRALPYIY